VETGALIEKVLGKPDEGSGEIERVGINIKNGPRFRGVLEGTRGGKAFNFSVEITRGEKREGGDKWRRGEREGVLCGKEKNVFLQRGNGGALVAIKKGYWADLGGLVQSDRKKYECERKKERF